MPRTILKPAKNVWRIERAERAAMLVDAAALFGALRESLLQAQHSIFIIGWDLHSQTRLVGENCRADDGLPETLVDFLRALVERRPELVVHVLLWDYSMLYALEREVFPTLAFNWNTPNQIRLCLDKTAPFGSSQHQKIVVVDDCVAFSGGLDLTIRRWDTPEHAIDNSARCDPAGKAYGPFHDVQAVVDGAAARALADLARERWARADGADPWPVRPGSDAWPTSVTPDFRAVDIAIARTEPRSAHGDEIREVERLFLDSIDAAERLIYIENQYLTSARVAQHLAARMRRKRKLEAVMVAPKQHGSWLEAHTMQQGRIHFMRTLQEAGVADRVRLVYPEVTDGDHVADIMVHSKVMVVDDRFLRIGSANINNRSMGADSECDLAIEAKDAAQRRVIANLRNRLLAEHCGCTAAEVEAAVHRHGLVRAIDHLSCNERRLHLIEDGEPDEEGLAIYMRELGDPPRPLRWRRFRAALRKGFQHGHAWRVVAVSALVLLVLALTLAWHYTPLAGYADPAFMRETLKGFASNPWGPALTVGVFVAGGLVAFPLVILIAATAATFGPWLGLAIATVGAMASAFVTYAIGTRVGTDAMRVLLGPRLERLREKFVRRGVLAVAAVRLVPVAPFTFVNLAAGAVQIKPVDYLLGTLLGLAPGLLVMSALGHQVFRVLTEPTAFEVMLLVAAVAGWIAVSFGVQAVVSRVWGGTS
jgi:phospholipase D1/2